MTLMSDTDAGRCPGCGGDGGNNWFDRELCPEPCGVMHTRCRGCGFPLDGCDLQDDPSADESPLTGSAGELVRLRDSQQEANSAQNAEVRVVTAEWTCSSCGMSQDGAHGPNTMCCNGLLAAVKAGWMTEAAAQKRWDELWSEAGPRAASMAASSSSVSPSLTEKDLVSGQERPAPDGEATPSDNTNVDVYAELAEYRAAYASLRAELATIFGPTKPRNGETWNDSILRNITEFLVAHDV